MGGCPFLPFVTEQSFQLSIILMYQRNFPKNDNDQEKSCCFLIVPFSIAQPKYFRSNLAVFLVQ